MMSFGINVVSPLLLVLLGSSNAFIVAPTKTTSNVGAKIQALNMVRSGNWGNGEFSDYNGVRNGNQNYDRGNTNQYYNNDGYSNGGPGYGRSNDYYSSGSNSNGYYGDSTYGSNGVSYNNNNDGVYSTANINHYNSNSNDGTYHPLKASSYGNGNSRYNNDIGYGNNANYNARYNEGYYNDNGNMNMNSRYNNDVSYNSYGGNYNDRFSNDRYSNNDYGRTNSYGSSNRHYGNNSYGASGGMSIRANDPDLLEKTPNLLNQADFMGYHGSNESSRNAFERQANRNDYGYGGYNSMNNNRGGGGYYNQDSYSRNGDYGNGYGSNTGSYNLPSYSSYGGGGSNYGNGYSGSVNRSFSLPSNGSTYNNY